MPPQYSGRGLEVKPLRHVRWPLTRPLESRVDPDL